MYPINPNTQLLSATITGDIKGLISSIQAGADINARTSCNNTALILASAFGHISVVYILLALGADRFVKDDEGLTASLYAMLNGYNDIYEILNEDYKE